MSNTPRVDAVVGEGRLLDPDKDFVRLAAIYSDLLNLARDMERELSSFPRKRREANGAIRRTSRRICGASITAKTFCFT